MNVEDNCRFYEATDAFIVASKRKRIPRLFWEWSRMHKQSIPGRLSPPTRPGYEAIITSADPLEMVWLDRPVPTHKWKSLHQQV